MKLWLPIPLGMLFAACGGSGGDDGAVEEPGDGNIGWVEIREPIVGTGSFRTIAPSIEIVGNAFVSPADTDCVTVQPVQLTLTWRNDSTGQSGSGGIFSFCRRTFLGVQWVSSWAIPRGAIDLQFGDNVIDISAADNAGNSGTSTINVIRDDDVIPPVIVGRQPAHGATDVAVNQAITVTFNEAMLRSSLTEERFTVTDPDGFEITGFLGYDDRNLHWQFDPQFDLLYSTTYSVTISGLVEDEFGGNPMGSDVNWTFTTGPNPDVIPPQVTGVVPDPRSTCVAPDTNVIAAFDEPLDSASVNGATFALTATGGAAIDGTVTYAGTTATLDPLLPLVPATGYEARLTTGITDLAGNALNAEFRWSFTTANTVAAGDWSRTSMAGAPFERLFHTAVWNGSEVIVWGGFGWQQSIGAFVETDTGSRYDPITDAWTPMSTEGVPAKSEHTAVMAGNEMFVWGGSTNTGFRYDPATDAWTAMSTIDAPTARRENAAVWTGTEMIVWGGESTGGQTLNTGARYDPINDDWTPMSTVNAPSPRRGMAYVWTGTELIVWGGIEALSGGPILTDGARYDPATDTWKTMAGGDAAGSTELIAAWTGTEMIVWNGGQPSFVDAGGFPVMTATLRRYDPVTDSWRATSSPCEPYLGAGGFYAHWTGSRLFAWSGADNGGYFYDPAADDWEAIDSLGGPPARSDAASVWTGDRFILWGGQEAFGLQATGFVFQE